MKATKGFYIALGIIFSILLCECSSKTDERLFQAPKIVGVVINGVLYLPTDTNNIATVVLPAGTDLTNMKVGILATNCTVQNFANNTQMDVTKPLTVTLNGQDGSVNNWTVQIQSPPKLLSLTIEGLVIDPSKIFVSATSLAVQVPEGTDLSALKVSLDFVNGTLQDFTNGQSMNYSNTDVDPMVIHVLGIDGITVYPYQFVVTTKPVGPASIESMTINGLPTDSVIVTDSVNDIVTPYVHGLTDFTSANVTLAVGFGNTIDPSFTGQGLNLLTGNPTVKITNSVGITVTFTIGTPQVSLPALCTVSQSAIPGTNNTSVRGAALSGMNVVLSAQNSSVGCGYVYDFTGAQQTSIAIPTSPAPLWGLHKVASDDDGVMLFSDLGLSAATETVFKCDNVTGTMTPYIQFTGASLGSSTSSFRNGGIKIQGELSGNAIITLTAANTNEVYVWTVTGGVLNQTPAKYSSPYSFSNYWTVTPTSSDPSTAKYIVTGAGSTFNGLTYASNPGSGTSLASAFEISNSNLTECAVTTFNGRIYMAYTYLVNNGVGVQLCLFDITDGSQNAFKSPIMNILWSDINASIGNATMATDIKVINGKLYVLYMQTSVGFKVFCLNP